MTGDQRAPMTHEAKFTPGPWVQRENYIYSESGEYIADIKLADDDPEVIATAKLIAAAPDMLEALKKLSAMYSHAWDLADGGLMMMAGSVDRFEAAHEAAQKAIAKATGQQPPVSDHQS